MPSPINKPYKPYRSTVKRKIMNNTYTFKWSKYPIHVFAENKKEAVEYLTKLGYNATMKNVHLLHNGQW